VLGSADRLPTHVIGQQLDISRPSVQRWLDRYEECGLSGIEEDRPRPGRPRVVTPVIEEKVVRKTLYEKPPHETCWSHG
jgi:transposase